MAALRFPIRNRFGLRYDDTWNIDRQLLSGAAFGIIYSVGSHALLWNIRYADHGGKLSVLRSLYHDFHLFSGDRKSRFQYSDSIMQTTAFPCSCLMVSEQIIPTERNLACISCCGNRHYAHCSHTNGMASPQKYLIKIAFLSGNSEYSICNAFPLVIKIHLPRRGRKYLQVNMYGAAIAARKESAEQTAQRGDQGDADKGNAAASYELRLPD